MDDARIFGNNCRALMQSQKISEDRFAESLGFSIVDVKKMLDGRMALYKDDVCDIAAFFHVPKDDLFIERGEDVYTGNEFMHCMGDFKNPENKQLILDIFDQYCTLKECVESY